MKLLYSFHKEHRNLMTMDLIFLCTHWCHCFVVAVRHQSVLKEILLESNAPILRLVCQIQVPGTKR
jgi:hypothetical protein